VEHLIHFACTVQLCCWCRWTTWLPVWFKS